MNSRHLPLFFVDTLPPTDGVSILPTFLGFDQPPKDYLYWEFCTNNAWGHAVRKGQWKAVSLSLNEVRVLIAISTHAYPFAAFQVV